ncbi:MAG: hypothetical protein DCF26_05345 [Burkholderiales bacterium]|nr:MAG: hypothetical protein DCF26_05345 [Burkholderiales bacterium]
MGKVCERYGTDNREKAMFCLGCGMKLVAGPHPEASPASARADAAHAGPDTATTSVAPARGVIGKRLLQVGLLLGAAALTAWFYLHQQSSGSQQPMPAPVAAATAVEAQAYTASVPEVPAPATEPVTAPVQPAFDPAASAATAEQMIEQNKQRARLNQQRLERERRERLLAGQEQALAARELERQREEQASRQAGIAAAQPVRASPAPIQPVAPVLTVSRICDQAGNFFAREVCRLRECNKASHASDPICVNFRRMEENNRALQQNE